MTGSGTQADPYIIYDVNDLQAMEDDLTAYYELANDIDASATIGWNGGAGFSPVGDSTNRFTGHLDGRNHTISGLSINRPAQSNIGLFGYVSTGFTATDIGLVNCSIVGLNSVGSLVGGGTFGGAGSITWCYSSGSIQGNAQVGGLVGDFGRELAEHCSSSCTVTGSGNLGGLIGFINDNEVRDCFATGEVIHIGAGSAIGGLIGSNSHGPVLRSFATGNVNGGVGDRVGGLIGSLNNADAAEFIQDCYARGDVTGNDRVAGLIGYIYRGNVDNCYSTGLVTGNTKVGGLIGWRWTPLLAPMNTTNSFWDTDTSGTLISDGGLGRTTVQMKIQATFTGAGWDFTDVWRMTTCNDDYPCLRTTTPCCCDEATVTTDAATLVEETTVTINGTLDDDGDGVCNCRFEYGRTTDYAKTTDWQSKRTGEAFSENITGLTPGRHYHFRTVARNPAGKVYGSDRGFFAKGGKKGNPHIDQLIYQHVERMD